MTQERNQSRDLSSLNSPAGHPFRDNIVPDNQARAPSGKDKDVLRLVVCKPSPLSTQQPPSPALCIHPPPNWSSQQIHSCSCPGSCHHPTFSPDMGRGRPGLGEVWATSQMLSLAPSIRRPTSQRDGGVTRWATRRETAHLPRPGTSVQRAGCGSRSAAGVAPRDVKKPTCELKRLWKIKSSIWS